MNMIAVGLTLLQADLELATHRKQCSICDHHYAACLTASDLRKRTLLDNAIMEVRWQDSCRKGVEQ